MLLFFVLSGLVIAHAARTRRGTLRDFALARIARIVPLAAFSILFALAAYALAQWLGLATIYQGEPNETAGPAQFVLPLLFLSESAFGSGPVWNPPYWSLCYEVWYYALFAAAFFLTGRQRVIALALFAVVAGIKILLLLPIWLMGAALAAWSPARRLSKIASWALLLVGIRFMSVAHVHLFDSVALVQPLTGLGSEDLGLSRFFLNDYIFGAGAALALLGLRAIASQAGGLLERSRRPVRWMANCSFTVYLLHWPLLTLLGGLNLSVGSSVAGLALGVAAIVALFGQIARLTEHRRHWVRAWLDRRFPGEPPSAVPGAQLQPQ